MRTHVAGRRWWIAAGLALFWIAALAFAASTFVLHNDHFDRISRARQIARYGELPFRDFFDPGYFATLYTSAALQRLIGDNLLGELLLTSVFIAFGATLVLILAHHLTGSIVASVAAAVLALFSIPRPYDFDKFLFYPLGLLLCWGVIARPRAATIALLAAGIVAGASFRYDTGVYIAAAALAALVVAFRRDPRALARRLGHLLMAVCVMSLPVLVAVQLTGGIANAADQVITYARRERARTSISSLPRFSVGPLVTLDRPPLRLVRVRWAASVDAAARERLAAQYHLLDETPEGPPEHRSWNYHLDDPSLANVLRLISDPRVEDTHGIDRSTGALPPESFATKLRRSLPLLRVRVLPRAVTHDNAAAFLYSTLWMLPLLAVAVLWLPAAARTADRTPQVISASVLLLILNAFILRDPVAARVGGIAAPAAVLACWVAVRLWQTRWSAVRVAVLVMLAILVTSISELADWQRRVIPQVTGRPDLSHNLQVVAAFPPPLSELQSADRIGMVEYLRGCTRPRDRVFAAAFLPEIYFFTQRGFAAGMVATFGGHWSDPRYAAQMVEKLSFESVPIVILEVGNEQFRERYPRLDAFIRHYYRKAGETDFGSQGDTRYEVWVDQRRVPTGTYAAWALPCYA